MKTEKTYDTTTRNELFEIATRKASRWSEATRVPVTPAIREFLRDLPVVTLPSGVGPLADITKYGIDIEGVVIYSNSAYYVNLDGYNYSRYIVRLGTYTASNFAPSKLPEALGFVAATPGTVWKPVSPKIDLASYDVFWSPEGLKIATVLARSESEAITKAPKPYRKFRGELYAVFSPSEIQPVFGPPTRSRAGLAPALSETTENF